MTTTPVGRRAVLAGGLVAAGAAGAALLPEPYAEAKPGKKLPHFQHGVASGDPLPHAVVLWTRVTPTAASRPGSGKGPSVKVGWEVATDKRFRNVVRHGSFPTGPVRDHTVKVDVTGLAPATWYYYRFTYAGQHSRVGRTRTAPAATALVRNLRFGVVSCANLQAGWFTAYRGLAERKDLHAIIHLGDYFYEYGPGEYGYGPQDEDIRPHQPAHEALSLSDYRIRHAQYKRDADLSRLHATYPWIITWDDHEVADNQYKDGAVNHQPATEGSWADRKRAAHRAYDEWMPVRLDGDTALNGLRKGLDDRIYRRFTFGDLAELSMLDLRSYRDPQIDTLTGTMDAIEDPDRTITGAPQMAWLKRGLARSRSTWNVVGNPVMVAPVSFADLPDSLQSLYSSLGGGVVPSEGIPYNPDQWDGYVADRQELLEHIVEHKVDNVVFITGDIHSAWVCDVPIDPATYPDSASAAVEFVGTSVTSNNLKDQIGAVLADPTPVEDIVETSLKTANRHIKYLDLNNHGFSILDLTPKRAQMDWWIIGDRASKKLTLEHTTSWATRAGSSRVHEVTNPVT